jgi:hypothetical protein
MAKDLIRYDLLAQEALRGVVRRVLADVARTGLPGDHHFLIAFATDYPGVRLSQRLREQYPQEMTIVLQHQFWDLGVTEHTFEVGLSFSGTPERLLVPFEAITQFFDPSVNFGLKFEIVGAAQAPVSPPAPSAKPAAVTSPDKAGSRKAPPKGAGTEPVAVPPSSVPRLRPAKPEPDRSKPATMSAKPAPDRKPAATSQKDDEPPPPANGGGAQVVSLDKFRKK